MASGIPLDHLITNLLARAAGRVITAMERWMVTGQLVERHGVNGELAVQAEALRRACADHNAQVLRKAA